MDACRGKRHREGGHQQDLNAEPVMTRQARGTAAGTEILGVSEVSVTLSGRRILDDVSFTVRPGEFTELIGPNGAGKTTLLRVILGLQRPTGGQVTVLGRPRSPRNRSRLRLPSRDRGEAVRQMLHAVDAGRFADARVGNLSGGEQQRVLIAHALISRPRLLLLDEPLANLDLRSSQEIIALLARIAREQQIAVLLSAHEMNPLLPVMDRIVYLAAGRAASGPTAEVVTGEVLSRLYGHHVDVLNVHGRVLVVAGSAPDGVTAAVGLPAAGVG